MNDKLNSEFFGKKILITGASKGLGMICAEYFEKQGAHLALVGRSENNLFEIIKKFRNPKDHVLVIEDLLEFQGIQNACEKVKNKFKNIDIILHSLGGGYGFREPLLSWGQFNTLHKLNVAAGAEINRIFVPDMIANQFGRIIHICSIASHEAVGSVGYNSVKAALSGYVRSLGRELASHQIVVTGILPGAFYGPENSWRRLESQKPEVVKKFIEERLPRKFIAEGEEIVPLVSLLASTAASMMAGSCIPIDAGEGKSYGNG